MPAPWTRPERTEETAAGPRPASWPEQAVDRLTTMWRNGATGPAIAAALTQEFGTPRSRSAVMGMVHRLGLKGQQGPPAEEPVEVALAPVEAAPEPEPIPEPICQPEPVPAFTPAPVLTVVRPEPRPAEWPPADGIPMVDLRWGECRWPVSGFHALQHRFCAAQTTSDSPYCAEHRRKATAPREGRGPGRYPGWAADGGVA
ncbi:MAG: hypothetical protein K2X71_10290 [Methylobacterium sp.]|uniref:GcrA family cell cycle regulator n=1 Tax=Methylobacterium sp. TaxID=409 RepID=UPI0025871A23|nr:GcrA family cell cycle regulator [Methylobacterium sp.]MBY0296414.1 hypothetical protein [Methylobacterium sp.]